MALLILSVTHTHINHIERRCYAMIYFTEHLPTVQKDTLTQATAAAPLPKQSLTNLKSCLVYGNKRKLYYISLQKNNNVNNMFNTLTISEYKTFDAPINRYTFDLFKKDCKKHNIWEKVVSRPMIIITDVVLNNPNDLPDNALEINHPKAYTALIAVGFMDKRISPIGLNIRRLLIENDMTQRELCDAAGLTEPAVSRIVNSQRVPQGNSLAKLANALHVSTDYLLGIETKDDPKTEYQTILRLIRKNTDIMTKEQKLEIINRLL